MSLPLPDREYYAELYWQSSEEQRRFDDLVMVRVDRPGGKRSKIHAETRTLDPVQYHSLLSLGLQSQYGLGQEFPLSLKAIAERTRPRRTDAPKTYLQPRAVSEALSAICQTNILARRRKGHGPGAVFWWKFSLPCADHSPPDGDTARDDIREAMEVTRLSSTQAAVYCPLRYLAKDSKLTNVSAKELQDWTGVYQRTIDKTLRAMVPAELGHCAGIKEVDISQDEAGHSSYSIVFDHPSDLWISRPSVSAKDNKTEEAMQHLIDSAKEKRLAINEVGQ